VESFDVSVVWGRPARILVWVAPSSVITSPNRSMADRRSLREIEQLKAIAEQHVILSHADSSPFGWRQGA
jgi:hypothetical protein